MRFNSPLNGYLYCIPVRRSYNLLFLSGCLFLLCVTFKYRMVGLPLNVYLYSQHALQPSVTCEFEKPYSPSGLFPCSWMNE